MVRILPVRPAREGAPEEGRDCGGEPLASGGWHQGVQAWHQGAQAWHQGV